MNAPADNPPPLILVPTAHIWGQNDALYPDFGPVLSRMCDRETRVVVVHGGSHEVPGSKDPNAVTSAVHAIRRTVERALGAM